MFCGSGIVQRDDERSGANEVLNLYGALRTGVPARGDLGEEGRPEIGENPTIAVGTGLKGGQERGIIGGINPERAVRGGLNFFCEDGSVAGGFLHERKTSGPGAPEDGIRAEEAFVRGGTFVKAERDIGTGRENLFEALVEKILRFMGKEELVGQEDDGIDTEGGDAVDLGDGFRDGSGNHPACDDGDTPLRPADNGTDKSKALREGEIKNLARLAGGKEAGGPLRNVPLHKALDGREVDFSIFMKRSEHDGP